MCNNSDINQSYTISAISVLPPPTPSYIRDSRKDKNRQDGKGNKMTEDSGKDLKRIRVQKGKAVK